MSYRTMQNNLQEFISSAAWVNATTSATTITGLSFTPEAGATYRFETDVAFLGSGTGEGLTLSISPGNIQYGSADLRIRNTAGNSAIVQNSGLSTGASVAGASAAASPDLTHGTARGFFVAHASAPTTFAIQGAAENGGAHNVSIPIGCAILRVWRMA